MNNYSFTQQQAQQQQQQQPNAADNTNTSTNTDNMNNDSSAAFNSHSLFSHIPSSNTGTTNGPQPQQPQFHSPLNSFSMLKPIGGTGASAGAVAPSSSGSTSNYSTPHMSNLELYNGQSGGGAGNNLLASSLSSSASASSSFSSYSRQRFLYSKGFDLEDDLEFCPEIFTYNNGHTVGGVKFNPYTSMTFSPISPPNANVEPVNNNNLTSPTAQTAAKQQQNKKLNANATSTTNTTPVQQDRSSGTMSPRTHTPRIKKPLEIINPATGSKVGSPGIRN